METKLLRIAELAKSDPKMQFTSLAHLLDKQSLIQCHIELPNKKATGINGTTKEQYGGNLEENIEDLVSSLKNKSFRPVPVRRMYIPKLNSKKKRPLGIPEHEDKIVQKGVTKILNSIYEIDFLDCSFGFRPNRSCHDALKILNFYIEKRSVNYVVDVDIKNGQAYLVRYADDFVCCLRKSFKWEKYRLFLSKFPLPSPRVKVNIYDLRKEISYIL